MLEETYQKFPNADQVINNALIEAFCLHARNLIEFFAEEGRKYTTDEYRAFPHISGKKLSMIKTMINIHVSHMIYDGRTTNDADKIDHATRAVVLNMLSAEVAHFQAHLLKEHSKIAIRDLKAVIVPVAVSFGGWGATTTAPSSVGEICFSS